MSRFSFDKLLPSNEKVCQVDFHPVLPWLAALDRNDYLTVWDWEKSEVVHECQLGVSSQYNRQEVEFYNRAEQAPHFFGQEYYRYMAANYLVPQAFGKVRMLKFFDVDTLYWTVDTHNTYFHGAGAAKPSVEHLGKLAERRYLLLTCEKAVLLFDIMSKQVKWLQCIMPEKGGRTFQDCAVLPRQAGGPLIAVACGDGAIRVVDAFTKAEPFVVSVLSTEAKDAVAVMAVVPFLWRDALVVGDEKGGVYVFDEFTKQSEAPVPPAKTLQGVHKDCVLSVVYVPGPDAHTPSPRLVTVGADNRIAVFDMAAPKKLGDLKAAKIVKCKSSTLTGACAAPVSVSASGRESVIISTSGPQVLYFDVSSGEMQLGRSLAADLPSRTEKKQAKLYAIAGHLLRPDVVAVATNAGVAVLTAEPLCARAVCGLNAVLNFSAASGQSGDLLGNLDETTAQEDDPRAASVALVVNNSLVGATYVAAKPAAAQAPAEPTTDCAAVNAAPLTVSQSSRTVLAEMAFAQPDSDAIVRASADGSMLAVCKPNARAYKVFAKPAADGPWNCVDEGQGSDVVWHSSRQWLAVLVSPATRKAPDTSIKPKNAKEAQALEEAIKAAAAARSAAGAYVTVRAFESGRPVATGVKRLQTPAAGSPVAIHGGLLLGCSCDVSAGGVRAAEMQFYDWNSGDSIGVRLPAPQLVSFSPSCEFVAAAYADGVDIFHVGSTLAHLTRVAAPACTSAVWHDTLLFTASSTAVHLTFITPPADPGNELGTRTSLSAHAGGDGLPELTGLAPGTAFEVCMVDLATCKVANGRDLKIGGEQTELPLLTVRPGSLARIVHASEDVLWMCSVTGHAWAMPLGHPGLRCRRLVAAGRLKEARKLAQTALHHRFHDNLALFMSAYGKDAAAEALLLPGLTLELELSIAIKCGALQRGWSCLAGLLAGCQDRTLLSKVSAWAHRDVDPDAQEALEVAKTDGDPFALAGPTSLVKPGADRFNIAQGVMAVFEQAAGVKATEILARLPRGVQGRSTPLDQDLFSSAPHGDSPAEVAKVKQPPPSSKYKPMFPRTIPEAAPVPTTAEPETPQAAGATAEAYEDVIDWGWPLRPVPDPAAPDETGEATEHGDSEAPHRARAIGANAAPGARVLELGLQLVDAAVHYADATMLQATIQLMAPHTGIMTASQQQRLVAAVGACGLASQLADLTLSGTTPLMPSAALLAGFLSGDARVAARVLTKEGLLPLKALFMQSCGAGGTEASVEWETQLRMLTGGLTRELTITPQTM